MMISRLNADAKSIVNKLAAEFHTNLRIRRMAWLIAYILVLYMILGLSDFNTALREKTAAMQVEISRIARGSDTTEQIWTERLAAEETAQQQLTQSCWQAKNARLASADMQTELQQFYRTFDLANSRLALSDPEALELNNGIAVWVIRGDVRGRINLNRLPSLVNALESGENRFFLREVRFVRQRNSGTLDIMLAACFVRGGVNA